MAIIGTLPNNIQDGQVADAVPVMADFNFIVSQVNANAQPIATPSVGSLVSVQVFSTVGTATYTANPLANSVVVEILGGGAAGSGAVATGASQASAAGPGGAGGYIRTRITAGFNGVTVTVGAGGTGVTGGAGVSGGSSAFGAISAGGGTSGSVTAAVAGTAYAPPGPGGTVSGGSIVNAPGGISSFGSLAVATVGGLVIVGSGANSIYGTGGTTVANATGFGSGGAGSVNGASSAAKTGSGGVQGIVIVYEYA